MQIDQKLLDLFMGSLEENTEKIDRGLIELEKNKQDLTLVNGIMRSAHSIKGSSALVGFNKMKELTHAVETVMIDVEKSKIDVNEELITLLLKCVDRIRALKDNFLQDNQEVDISDLMEALKNIGTQEKKIESCEKKEPAQTQAPKGIELDKESIDLFVADLEEDIDKIDRGLIELEKSGQDLTLINGIMRAAHNIKGSSAMVGFIRMKEITHAVENVMTDVKNNKIDVNAELITLLLKCLDRIRTLKDNFVEGEVNADISDLIERIKNIGSQQKDADSENKKDEKKEFLAAQNRQLVADTHHGVTESKKESIQNIKVNFKSVENMINHVGELIILQTQIFNLNRELRNQYKTNTTLEQSYEMIEYMEREIKRLLDEFLQLSMTPMEMVFKNFSRMVRDLEVALGKKIDLVIENSNSRLDRSIAEEITNPLIHILRNSADHGIESPKDRAKAGKPERGIIKISTVTRGEQIVICIEDDGNGIDEEKVLRSAINKGLFTEEQAKSLTRKEILKLIFYPGFSTANEVSDISGRGVGMDVVLNCINKINGTIEVESERGQGTKITLKIPSTLSIMPSILFEINKKVICIPAINVDTVLDIQAELISEKDKGKVVNIEDMCVPLIGLYGKFGGFANKHNGKYYVVVCGAAEKKVAILVDRLLGSQKIIIKPLSSLIGKVNGIAGTAILEDGKIAQVMDVSDIVKNV